ncbi:MAG: hypothetical protein B9S32_10210 [Verrucomicrobia bacterium Tous-C9LFEB]|nr:MAG: hypothetical protein B9S32_10210 [Verrucomicrobia bacterium Tous-C9LFEB]
MPKIVHIIHESRGGGGMAIALAYFHRYLPQFETVAITGKLGALPEKLHAQGVRTHALPLDHVWRALFSIPQVTAVLYREKPDIVILHGQWGGFCGAVAAWLTGVKRVLYYTGMPCFYIDWDLYRVVRNRFVEQFCCTVATRVVCLSTAGRYQYLLRRLAPEKKILYIPNGVDTAAIQPAPDKTALRRELHLPVDVPLVVSVGRLEDQKRVDWLVQAWRQVEAECPTAHLAIIGDGRDRKGLERLASAHGLQRCHFLGTQPNGYRYFQAADAGVITSLFEGHPVALLEAMAAGCPMVGTAADGIPETIVDGVTGFCVPLDVPTAIAEKLVLLLQDSVLRENMGRAACERVKREYALDSVSEQQIRLAQEILAADASS